MVGRLLVVLALAAALALGLALVNQRRTEMPAFRNAPEPRPRGAFHVHSEASHDSDLPLDAIVQVAARLRLDFVVVTDHDVQLAAPITVDGVTVLSSAELKTPFGHLIQLGASDILPSNLRGERSIHDAVRALGGIPILAHPTDPKRPWDGPIAGAGGIEIANLASSARRQGGPVFLGLLPAFAIWRFEPALALAQAYDRDDGALKRWDGESDPTIAGLCAGDAHGRIDVRDNLTAWQLVLDAPLPANLELRAASIVEALGHGRFHCVAGVVAEDAGFDFYARLEGGERARSGDTVPLERAEALVVQGPRSTTPQPASILLLRNGEEVVRTRGEELVYTHPSPGTYRVEVRVPIPTVVVGQRAVPVIYSNRIRVRGVDTWRAPPVESMAVPAVP